MISIFKVSGQFGGPDVGPNILVHPVWISERLSLIGLQSFWYFDGNVVFNGKITVKLIEKYREHLRRLNDKSNFNRNMININMGADSGTYSMFWNSYEKCCNFLNTDRFQCC